MARARLSARFIGSKDRNRLDDVDGYDSRR